MLQTGFKDGVILLLNKKVQKSKNKICFYLQKLFGVIKKNLVRFIIVGSILGYVVVPFIHNYLDSWIAKVIWYPSNLFLLVFIFLSFKDTKLFDDPLKERLSNIGIFWVIPILPSVFVFSYYNIENTWKWVLFAYAFVLIPYSFWNLFSYHLIQEDYSQNEKEKMVLNMAKYVFLFWLVDLLYMAIFNGWLIAIFIFGILTLILIVFNLSDAFLHGFSNLRFFMALELVVGFVLSGYLIYIIPNAKIQNIVLTIFAALVGGIFTLLGVAWTIKKADNDRHNDLLRIENERREEERKKYVPWINYYVADNNIFDTNIYVVNTNFGSEFKYSFNDFLLHNSDFSNFLLKALIVDDNVCSINPSWYIKKEATIRIHFENYVLTNKRIENVSALLEDLLGNEYIVHIYFKSIDLGEFIEIKGEGCSKAEYQDKT